VYTWGTGMGRPLTWNSGTCWLCSSSSSSRRCFLSTLGTGMGDLQESAKQASSSSSSNGRDQSTSRRRLVRTEDTGTGKTSHVIIWHRC
jgi:hypothetical protein